MTADFFQALMPEHILLSLIAALMLLETFKADRRIGGFLYISALLGGMGAIAFQLQHGYACEVISGEIRLDRFSQAAGILLLGCGMIHGLCSMSHERRHKFWILAASSLLGALIVLKSTGFIPLFLGIEMLSLPGLALILVNNEKTGAAEGAFKYLLLSSIASAMILFGISFAYGSSGALSIAAFAAGATSDGIPNPAATILILAGFFTKAALFPFHGWAPDAYSSAKLPIAAFLSSIVKGAVVLALLRIFSDLALNDATVTIIIVLSILSIFYGNIAAIHQHAFKRMLAYSSIAHAGYMMFALSGAASGRVGALLYYVAVYAVTTIVSCACISLISGEDDSLDSLNGAFRTHPAASIILSASLLSLAAIPPFPGFIAKFLVFKTVVASGQLIPAIIAFIGGYIGVFFYLGIISRLFKNESSRRQELQNIPRGRGIWKGVVIGCATLILLMLVPDFIQWILEDF